MDIRTTAFPRSGAAMVAALSLALGAAPAAHACPLALVLAIDVSSSVDDSEYELQRQGLAEAFRDPQVGAAIRATGGLLASAFEWSGREQQVVKADWTWLETPEEIARFADRLADTPRSHRRYPTALGYALGYAAIHHGRAPRECIRRVVDMAGDGINNEGFPPESAYRAFDYSAITVNGLAIAGDHPDPVRYYRNRVIRGPGAFVEVARGFEDYARAMKRKLLRELDGPPLALGPGEGASVELQRQS
ncbi:DUF1194 domain-containing protein, partial [Stappia sp.]|uniref:DUF1194 domain-containing protein n=1 Tax=Stappia sp. TaxID=1870903 RepID=UPI003A99B688